MIQLHKYKIKTSIHIDRDKDGKIDFEEFLDIMMRRS